MRTSPSVLSALSAMRARALGGEHGLLLLLDWMFVEKPRFPFSLSDQMSFTCMSNFYSKVVSLISKFQFRVE